MRISAHDWASGGISEADVLATARAFKAAGVNLISVSTGQTVPDQQPVYGRMWQTPYADLIRNSVGIPTIAVGNIFEADHVNTIVGAGRADLCAIAPPHLADPVLDVARRREPALRLAVVAGSLPHRQESARAQPRARGTSAPGAV